MKPFPSDDSFSLHLNLQVFAVILTLSLSKGKNPEELNTPQPLGPFYQDSLPLCIRLSLSTK
jgi:hypothetical protein